MKDMNDFENWINSHDLSDYNDVYCLYRSVADVDEWGSFKTVHGRGKGIYILKSTECEENLVIASEKARKTFLNMIEEKFCGELDIEGWYSFNYANEKDD